MKKFAALMILAMASPVWAADSAKKEDSSKSSSAASVPSQEELVTQFRDDLRAKRADITAKNLTMTAEQAAKFWPLFEQFQKEQTVIVDEQIKATQKYAEKFEGLSDADAQTYVNALLTRDQKIHDLRVKWLAKFQTVVPIKTAARAIQLDRRLGLVTQVRLAAQIPLVR